MLECDGVQFVIRRSTEGVPYYQKWQKRKLEELDLGVQPSSDKASINFVEYPIDGGREINKVTFKNPL